MKRKRKKKKIRNCSFLTWHMCHVRNLPTWHMCHVSNLPTWHMCHVSKFNFFFFFLKIKKKEIINNLLKKNLYSYLPNINFILFIVLCREPLRGMQDIRTHPCKSNPGPIHCTLRSSRTLNW